MKNTMHHGLLTVFPNCCYFSHTDYSVGYLRCLQNLLLLFAFGLFRWLLTVSPSLLLLFTFRFFRWPKRIAVSWARPAASLSVWPHLLHGRFALRWTPLRHVFTHFISKPTYYVVEPHPEWKIPCMTCFRWLLTVSPKSTATFHIQIFPLVTYGSNGVSKIYCYFSHSDYSVGPKRIAVSWARPAASLSVWPHLLHGLCGGPPLKHVLA